MENTPSMKFADRTTGNIVTVYGEQNIRDMNGNDSYYPSYDLVAVSSSRNVTVLDDGQRYYATTAITLTIPAGLNPRPEFTVMPPSTGNLSIAFSGGSQGNGAATTITRTRASNPAGVVISPWPDVTDGYGVSGV